MSLSDLASLGSLVSGLAVLGSLIYLNIQTRQATKHQRSLMMQGRATRTIELALRSGDSSFASSLEKLGEAGPDALSLVELSQIVSMVQANIISLEETWLEGREGLQSKTTHEVTMRRIALMFSLPVFRAGWAQQRLTSDPEFVAVVDRILSETSCIEPSGWFEGFRRALKAEMAKLG